MSVRVEHRRDEFPEITVVVLNWNGKRYLGRCLTALRQTAYPAERFKVILADNASTDGSPEWVRERFPEVQVLENGENLGFGGGNNRAIQASSSPFVALLNTDTAVQPDWLLHLVEPHLADRRVGASTAKLLFLNDYLPLSLRSEVFSPQRETGTEDQRDLGIQVYDAQVTAGVNWQDGRDHAAAEKAGHQAVRLLGGFFPPERDAAGRAMQWSGATAELGVPLPERGVQSLTLEFTLGTWRPDERLVAFSLACAGYTLFAGAAAQPRRIRVNIPAALLQHARPLIQSAGSSILPDGSGRDRGTIVKHGHVYPPWDGGGFNTAEEVFHFNGAACLLRREMLAAAGLFDERFFMYYEDMDLAWRARAQGWQVRYAPQAIVRHVHSGSAGEWSPLFTYNVDLNRLLMLLKNAPWRLARQQVARFAAETAWNAAQAIRGVALREAGTRGNLSRLWIRVKVWARLLVLAPSILRSRRIVQSGNNVSEEELARWTEAGADDATDH